MPSLRAVLAIVALLGWLPASGAAEDPGATARYDQYSLQARAEAALGNDYLQATMAIELERAEAELLAAQMDADLQWARAELAQFTGLQHEIGHYSTWPVYRDDKIIAWRSSQTLLVGGGDFVVVRRAIAQLQPRLHLRDLQFRSRGETRRALEDELIGRALENFRHRAQIVQQTMGASSYRVVHLAIDTGDQRPAAAPGTVRPVAPGGAGRARLTVDVSGQIQLLP